MPKLQKSVQKQNLAKYQTWIVDTEPTSRYFRLNQVPDVLTGGKNAFLINGSPELIGTTEVKIELIDSEGNTVFVQPIRNYVEGLARIVSIEVYENTPSGPATLTIMGQLRFDENGNEPPPEWKGVYNVKWQKQVVIAPNLPNSTKIRLYQRPEIQVGEVLAPYRNAVQGANLTIQGTGSIVISTNRNDTGSVPGLPSFVTTLSTVGFNIDRRFANNGFLFARLTNRDGLVSDYTASISRVINDTTALLTFIDGVAADTGPRATSAYTMSFLDDTTFATTPLSRSFADIRLSKLTTFSGDVARAKIYVKSLDQPGDYQQVTDIQLEATELTLTQSLSANQQDVRIGYIADQSIIDAYWTSGSVTSTVYTPSGVCVLTYDRSELLDAMYLSSPLSLFNTPSDVPQFFIGTKEPLTFTEGMEYTLSGSFATVKTNPIMASRMDVYAVGEAFPSSSDSPLGYQIASFTVPEGIDSRVFDGFSKNFTALNTGTAYLRFVIYSGGWFFSNIGIFSARESGFNPDEVRVVTPLIGRRYERLQFKAELYDVNSNLVPVLIESEPVFFDGGNVVFKGTDHRIEGTIRILPSGSSPTNAINLGSTGFFNGTTFVSGSVISIGSGSFFNRNTPFLVATDLNGSPFISIADKLRGYVDPGTGNFILDIDGDFLVGSGSNKFDVRSLLPRNSSDIFYDRVRGGQGDFQELRGRRAVTAGEWNDQIARMGQYTRGSTGYIGPFVSSPPAISSSVNPFVTGSIAIYTSGSITMTSDQSIANNVLYADMNVGINEGQLTNGIYLMTFAVGVSTSWLGFPSATSSFQTLVSDDRVYVAEQGQYNPDPILKYPIPIPGDRVGNTLYYLVRLSITTTPS